MRTLSDRLLAAQKKPDRLPYVEAKAYDYEAGIKRLSWTRLYEGSEPDNHHGIAFDGQGSMHRIRADGNNLCRQKITSPGPSSDYSQWTNIATDCGGPCAIAAYGAKVYIFYETTGNVLWKYYSHDYGQSWNNAQLVSYADVLSLASCWWGTGNIVVCFALKSNELNGIVLDSSDQSTSQHINQFHGAATHIFLNTYGIGATYNPFWPQCEIVLAAKESATPITITASGGPGFRIPTISVPWRASLCPRRERISLTSTPIAISPSRPSLMRQTVSLPWRSSPAPLLTPAP